LKKNNIHQSINRTISTPFKKGTTTVQKEMTKVPVFCPKQQDKKLNLKQKRMNVITFKRYFICCDQTLSNEHKGKNHESELS
jgi:hypothetical protein